MKTIFRYILPLLLLSTAVCCSKEEQTTGGKEQTGAMQLSISATRTQTAGYDPTQHLLVKIYNKGGGLLRKYTSLEDLPERLELIAGEYLVAVEAGEICDASFETRFYKGEKAFTVTAGSLTPVEVVCNIRNTVVEVKFDKTLTENFGTDFHACVAIADTFTEGDVEQGTIPGLTYTADAKGYFTLPEGVTTMAWHFEGQHVSRPPVAKDGLLTELKAGAKYALTFKYSPDLPGFVDAVLVKVDTSAEEEDDTLIFSVDPEIVGEGFEMTEVQKYVTGEKKFSITTAAKMTGVTLTIGEQIHQLLGPAATPVNGIQVNQIDAKTLDVTLSDAFFANRAGGNHTLSFHITDEKKGELTAESTFRLQGLLPVIREDYDLWTNAITLKAVVFDPSNIGSFTLMAPGGSQRTLSGDDITWDDDVCKVVFKPEWEASTNPKGKTVYTIKAGSEIAANTVYTGSFAAGTVTSESSFKTATGDLIPDGDMESALSCFTTNNGNTTFWGSGNNSTTPTLCTQGNASGDHYANMQSESKIGAMAAGNLFTGTFSFSGTTGTVKFGQKYTYTARPKAMHVRYHAKVGIVDSNSGNGPLAKGTQDKSRVFVAIVDWKDRHTVASSYAVIGTSSCSGSWDPENGPDAVSEGKILGYASMWIEQTTAGDVLVSSGDALKIYWYDKEAAAPTGNYTLAISCAANAYGDFFNGCTTNHLWVDDFEWVY